MKILVVPDLSVKETRLKYQQQRRRLNNNQDTKKYEKTLDGYLMRMYRNMKSRVTGVQSKKAHLYFGKELMDKESFYEFAKCSPMFRTLFYQYKREGYNQKLAPTPDRVDPTKGYTVDNIQWVTNSVNSSRGARRKYEQTTENSMYS
jgi:hypothetical protein